MGKFIGSWGIYMDQIQEGKKVYSKSEKGRGSYEKLALVPEVVFILFS